MAGILDPRGKLPVIQQAAQKYKVDPGYAARVAQSEGLSSFYGDGGKSGGAFQLYTGGGLGNEFQKETGLNPLDPKNEDATIDYAMKKVSQGGWGPWNGARKIGITGMMGVNGQPGGDQQMAAKQSEPSFPNVQQTAEGTASAGLPPAPATRTAGMTPPPANTLSMNNPLAGTTPQQGAAPLHSNQAINEALMQAFHPIIPDQVNSLLGPAIGNIQGHANPIAFYQPRQAAQIQLKK